jgi:hypothetical protein
MQLNSTTILQLEIIGIMPHPFLSSKQELVVSSIPHNIALQLQSIPLNAFP